MTDKPKDKPCYIYIDQEPLTSYREVTKKIASKEIPEKIEGLTQILGSMVNEDHYPNDLMMSAIHNLSIVDDINLKKILFLFWEVIDKKNPDGKLKDEFILVCNGLRKDLESPNEYVRGRVLRLLTKLPYTQILENLKTAVFNNLDHPHPYVRSNALMCIMSFIEHFGVECVPENLGEKLKSTILKDSDNATKRNAYLVYSKIAPMESLTLTEEILENNEISDLGDLFALCICENLKKLCLTFTQKKSLFIRMLLELSVHKSHSVLFEIGSILLEVSSNPNIISSAVNILCSLLMEEKDNNTLIVILKKLISIKSKYKEILQEHILSFANILSLNFALELREIVFKLINELICQSNIVPVFDNFINTFNQLNKTHENETIINFKQMILECMMINLKKFPNIPQTYPLFLLDKNLFAHPKTTGDSSNAVDNFSQINAIKDLFKIYSNNNEILPEMLKKLIKNFEDIDNYEIMQMILWILSYYTKDFPTLKNIFDLIMKNLGDLDFELTDSFGVKFVEAKKEDEAKKGSGKKTITKTVVLPDGTYGTVTTVVDTKDLNKHKDNKYLRKFVLTSNFYFSANLVSCLTSIIFKMKKAEDKDEEKYKIYFYNAINIICSILKMNSDLVAKDPDNISAIQTCLRLLLSDDDEMFEEWNNTFKDLENSEETQKVEENNKVIINNTQPDDHIEFRHCKAFDPDNFDVVEENNISTNDYSNENEGEEEKEDSEKKNKKFIEVLSGSEDPLFVESVVEIFTFDLSIEFHIKNKTKNQIQTIAISLFVPSEFSIIEKPPSFDLMPGETKSVRACVKFSKTINAYIFGQLNYCNMKGQPAYLNLSGLFIQLLNTHPAEISDIQFRKNWIDYTWEHNVMLVSRKKSFRDIITQFCKELKMKLIFPKSIQKIEDDEPFLVANLYTQTKLGEDALVNVSIEKTKDGKIIGTCIIRSMAKEFMKALGEKIKAVVS
ncbi:MAG: hypothetical protein MJ252_19940 [archaeon]|nr:hypothetical protein [archaeon]